MGKIIFSSIAVTDIRGKIGGNVFSANANGAFLRNRVKGTNPRTAKQVAIRARVSDLAQQWRGLSDAERDAWQAATPEWPYIDSMGQTKLYTAMQLFMTLNNSLQAARPTAATMTSPPAPGTVGAVALTSIEMTVTAGEMSALQIDFAPTVPTGNDVIIYATGPVSPGIMRPGLSRFRQIVVLPAGTTTGHDIFDDYTANFGPVLEGQKVFVRAETVKNSNGQRAQGGTVSAVA